MWKFYSGIAVIIAMIFCWDALPANAQQDITPPALLDVRFEPGQIDTSKGPVTITVTIHVTDDLSGVEWIGFNFGKPGTTQQKGVDISPLKGFGVLLSGNFLDGIYAASMTLPQYSAYGTWQMNYFVLIDNVGNRIDVWRPEDEDEAARGTDKWPTVYNGFVFAVGNEVEQPQRQIYLPSLSTQ